MSGAPLVTVILTSYNHHKFIAEAIQSVLDQTLSDFELIIIDDCSVDMSWEVINSFQDARIKVFRNETRSRGLKGVNETIQFRSRGKYIAIHHSDDMFLPEKLTKQVDYLETHLDVAAVFALAQGFNEDGIPLSQDIDKYCGVFCQPNKTRFEWLNYFFYNGNCLCHPSVMIRKECFQYVGYYDRRYGSLPDFDMWIRLCLKYEIHIIQEYLLNFRILDAGKNASGDNPITYIRSFNEMYQILHHYLQINDIQEFISVFPQTDMEDPTDVCIKYQLAILALGSIPQADNVNVYLMARRAFGLNALYDIMRDPVAVELLKSKYGFDYVKLVEMSAQVDTINYNLIYADAPYGKHIVTNTDSIKNKGATFVDKMISAVNKFVSR